MSVSVYLLHKAYSRHLKTQPDHRRFPLYFREHQDGHFQRPPINILLTQPVYVLNNVPNVNRFCQLLYFLPALHPLLLLPRIPPVLPLLSTIALFFPILPLDPLTMFLLLLFLFLAFLLRRLRLRRLLLLLLHHLLLLLRLPPLEVRGLLSYRRSRKAGSPMGLRPHNLPQALPQAHELPPPHSLPNK